MTYSFTLLYVEKTFKDLKEDITKLSTIIKKSKSIKRVEIKQVFNMKIKLTESEIGNSHIISIKKQIPTNTANIAINMDTLLITVFFSPSNSPNNNYRGEKKNYNDKSRNKNKRTS